LVHTLLVSSWTFLHVGDFFDRESISFLVEGLQFFGVPQVLYDSQHRDAHGDYEANQGRARPEQLSDAVCRVGFLAVVR